MHIFLNSVIIIKGCNWQAEVLTSTLAILKIVVLLYPFSGMSLYFSSIFNDLLLNNYFWDDLDESDICLHGKLLPASIYLLNVNNGNTRTTCKICSKLTTPEWRQWRLCGVFTVNFEQILHIVLVFPLLTLNK